jgi:hypothetical protein
MDASSGFAGRDTASSGRTASSQSQAPAALSLIAVVGLVASVKSHIARALAKRTGRVHIEAGR